ncbi:MAG: DUF4440 domain-containing protein [Candidatus Aquirickettsiella gammari]|jgi:uncharacterized protein (TIGR02246 family)|uniref:DUF4440 domain-containing protein n=1 Tax=Candidatus Aquirickettsiella gammari TaxID=2016198 RepID=A0A370CJ62_9COXI|nr:MAG: DUF4440 domain-containing protein [Candidatus Aquirickettsiella gammari]
MCKKTIVSTVLWSCLLTAPAVMAMSTTTHIACVKTNKQEIAALFDRWNKSLKTGDATNVNANYTDNAVLLATISNAPRVTSAERMAYFKDFLSKHPIGKIDSRTISIGCNKAIDTGLYTFTLKNGKQLHARYTFTYLWNGHKWLISSHHSSTLPESTS